MVSKKMERSAFFAPSCNLFLQECIRQIGPFQWLTKNEEDPKTIRFSQVTFLRLALWVFSIRNVTVLVLKILT